MQARLQLPKLPGLDRKGGGSLGFLRGQARSPEIKSLHKNVFIFMDAGRALRFIKGTRDSKARFRKFPSSWMWDLSSSI